jgi:hypothetical protein
MNVSKLIFSDTWWETHKRSCGGEYIKIKEPEKPEKNTQKKKTATKGTSSTGSSSSGKPNPPNRIFTLDDFLKPKVKDEPSTPKTKIEIPKPRRPLSQTPSPKTETIDDDVYIFGQNKKTIATEDSALTSLSFTYDDEEPLILKKKSKSFSSISPQPAPAPLPKPESRPPSPTPYQLSLGSQAESQEIFSFDYLEKGKEEKKEGKKPVVDLTEPDEILCPVCNQPFPTQNAVMVHIDKCLL